MQEPVSVNYLGLRKLYESKGDQKRLDEMIVTYLLSEQKTLDQKEYIEKGKRIPFLDGIRVSEDKIRSLSFQNIMILLLNDAEPQTALKRSVFEKEAYHVYDYFSILNRFGKLSQEQLERAILDTNQMENRMPRRIVNIIKIMSGNKEEYDVDFSRLESAFVDYLNRLDIDMSEEELGDKKALIEAVTQFLMMPYNNSHDDLVKFLKRFKKTFPIDSVHLYSNLLDRLTSEIGTMSGLIDLIHSRRDLTLFAKDIRDLSTCWFDPKKRQTIEEQLFNEIIEGKCNHVGFALLLFPNLNARRNEIVNAWIRNERTLELDVYLEALLKNKFDISSYSYTAFDFAEYCDSTHLQASLQEKSIDPKDQTI